jgi:tetratricopeptide (TPR) repeat protein
LNGIWRCDEMNVTFQRPHNDFLWVWAELGLVGFAFKMIVSVGVIFPALRAFRNTSENSIFRFELASFLAFYIAGGIVAFFDFPNERAEHTLWLSILMAYLYVQSKGYYRTMFTISITKWMQFVVALVLLFASYVCFLKMKGEYHAKHTQIAQQQHNPNGIVKHSYLGESFAYTLDPFSMPLAWYCGNALVSAQQFDKGFECFSRAYNQHPYNRYVLNDLATCYVLKGNFKKAEELYKESVRISPRYDAALINLISLYIQMYDIEKAKWWEKKLMHDSEQRRVLKELIERAK